ncbi:tripartite ATP-independent transporter DctP family solute receptor [Microbacterium sp. W4I4]|uniref:TRAP transporter substrate-binding protein n=1 Tax=Microbacterium sp. W4I4 TaxID=3042295 RepID=UPI00278418AC|nr:TRAP transporter substrate-binding protein [Microbacterium sp. W4I4]MDQ0614898.1 tripartite ATP-independent transporter DctP family solute receptor [Microbacterium sp. W4I4]
MRTKKMLALASVALLAAGLAGCSSGGADDKAGGSQHVLRVAFNQNAQHPQAQAILEMSDALEEATDGAYKLELYPDATLGAQEATIEQVQSGTIDLAVVAGSLLENFNPDFAVVNLPYMYSSPEHQMSVLNDDDVVGDLYGTLDAQNIHVLAAYHGGVRNVYTKEPVKTPADLKGKKIRVIGSDTNVKMMELMGGVGTPMAQDEVYTAIQSGVLDGAENNELIYSSLSHAEIAPYYSRTAHLMMPDYLIASPTFWNGLDDDTKEIFQDLVTKSIDTQLAAFDAATQEAITAAKDAGATFIDVDTDAFREAVLPLHDEIITDSNRAVYDAINAARD